jgi:single-strand DNA-binding protein
MNRIVLIGRLVREPEIRYTAAGKAVSNFTLAVDRDFKNAQGEKEADFIRIVIWEKGAELCQQYTHKGSLVGIDGKLQIRNYEADGQKKQSAEVIAERVQFLDPKQREPGE